MSLKDYSMEKLVSSVEKVNGVRARFSSLTEGVSEVRETIQDFDFNFNSSVVNELRLVRLEISEQKEATKHRKIEGMVIS